MRYCSATALLVLLAFVGPARAMFMLPERAPVDRIITNAEAYIEEHPDDAEGYYILGRAHYLAWTLKSSMIPVNRWQRDDKADLPNLPDDWMARMGQNERVLRLNEATRRVRVDWDLGKGEHPAEGKQQEFNDAVNKVAQLLEQEGWAPPKLDQAALDTHAETAIKLHRKAIELDEDNALYHIGLASILEEYAQRGSQRDGAPILPDLRPSSMQREMVVKQWHEAALAAYAKAFRLAIREDRKLDERPLAGLESLVSYNAIEGYTRMAQKLDGEGVDADLARQMKQDKAKLDNLHMGAITPIIFSLEPGRQLFGSVTWWLLPGDGYRAMSLLDDNRDGELAGDELSGLALWFDRNSNAVADPGEVIPIEQTDIVGLKTTAITQDAGSPMHIEGLRLRDGRTLPTWDWIAPGVE